MPLTSGVMWLVVLSGANVMLEAKIELSRTVMTVGIAMLGFSPLLLAIWWGKRERRPVSTVRDADLGSLKVYKDYWEGAEKRELMGCAVKVSGTGRRCGACQSQKGTLKFVQENAAALIPVAVAASQDAIAEAGGSKPNDLRVSEVWLCDDPNCFDLILESASCSKVVPDDVCVSFSGTKVDETELLH